MYVSIYNSLTLLLNGRMGVGGSLRKEWDGTVSLTIQQKIDRRSLHLRFQFHFHFHFAFPILHFFFLQFHFSRNFSNVKTFFFFCLLQFSRAFLQRVFFFLFFVAECGRREGRIKRGREKEKKTFIFFLKMPRVAHSEPGNSA